MQPSPKVYVTIIAGKSFDFVVDKGAGLSTMFSSILFNTTITISVVIYIGLTKFFD